MNQFNSYFLIVMLILFLSSCATTHVTTENSQVTPEEWKYVSSYNYEKRSPGLGYSKKYSISFGWADVYEYDLGEENWQDGVADPLFNEHFRQIVEEVYQAERSGTYKKVKISHIEDEIINGVTLRHVVLHYKLRNKNVESHIYLSGMQGNLLKFRITLNLPIGSREKDSMVRFVTKMVNSTLNNKSNKHDESPNPSRVLKPDKIRKNREITL